MADMLDLLESTKRVSKASELYYNALREEKSSNVAKMTKEQEIKLLNLEALLSKDMTAAVHKIKVESEIFEQELRMKSAVYDRKMCNTQLESLKIAHYVLQKQMSLQ